MGEDEGGRSRKREKYKDKYRARKRTWERKKASEMLSGKTPSFPNPKPARPSRLHAHPFPLLPLLSRPRPPNTNPESADIAQSPLPSHLHPSLPPPPSPSSWLRKRGNHPKGQQRPRTPAALSVPSGANPRTGALAASRAARAGEPYVNKRDGTPAQGLIRAGVAGARTWAGDAVLQSCPTSERLQIALRHDGEGGGASSHTRADNNW